MAEITWIKLRTNMFDDEKIKLLERLPDGDMILIVWVKLLAQAGKVNCGGYIMIAENIPMTVDEMSVVFNRPIEKVTFAIQALQRYGMIEIDENSTIFITNWEKHQNIEGMEKIRIQNAERQKRYRERKKGGNELPPPEKNDSNVTHNVTVTKCNGTEEEKEKEKEKEKRIKEVMKRYDELENLPNYNRVTTQRKKAISARITEEGVEGVIAVLEGLNNDEYYIKAKLDGANWYKFDYVFKPEKFNMLVERFKNNYNTSQSQQTMQYNEPDTDTLYSGGDWE